MKQTRQHQSTLSFTTLVKASFLFEAAIHPMRQQLLGLLKTESKLTAKALSLILLIEEEICIQQLSILCGAGLLVRQQNDGEVFYRLNKTKLQQLYACAEALEEV